MTAYRVIQLALVGMCLGVGAVHGGPQFDCNQDSPAALRSRWSDELEALRPGAPIAYFELAEEILASDPDGTERALAEHLLRLSGALDPDTFARAACLMLAEMASQTTDRRRFGVLAEMFDRRPIRLSMDMADPLGRADRSTILGLGEVLSLYRRGEGARAEEILEQPGVRSLLVEVAEHLDGMERIMTNLRLYRRGTQRPLDPRSTTEIMVRTELAIIKGDDRTWSEDLLLNNGAPVAELDPSHIAEVFGVDPTRSRFRDGGWHRP